MVYDTGDFFNSDPIISDNHRCNVLDYCILDYNDKTMRIYFCAYCKKVAGYLKMEENVLKLSGEAVTGFRQNQIDEKVKKELI